MLYPLVSGPHSKVTASRSKRTLFCVAQATKHTVQTRFAVDERHETGSSRISLCTSPELCNMSIEASPYRRVYTKTIVQGNAHAILGDSHTHHHYYGALSAPRADTDSSNATSQNAQIMQLIAIIMRALTLCSRTLPPRDASRSYFRL